MLYLLPYQSSPPATLISLNRRLEKTLHCSRSDATLQTLLSHIADYLHCCHRQHEDQIKPWKGAFLSLARETHIEMSKPQNRDLQYRVAPWYDGVYEYRREWHWGDFARDEFGLQAVSSMVDAEMEGDPPNSSHNMGSALLTYNDDSTRTLTD